jgi:hypothetical protein
VECCELGAVIGVEEEGFSVGFELRVAARCSVVVESGGGDMLELVSNLA